MPKELKTDVLIIGGGCAGLRAAITARKKGSEVCLVSKGMIGGGSATAYLDHLVEFTALGVSLNDTDRKDYETDLMSYGHEVNNPELIKQFVNGTEHQLNFLKGVGMETSTHPEMLPSHTKPRVLRGKGEFGTNLLYTLKKVALDLGVEILEYSSMYELNKRNFPSDARILKRKMEGNHHTDDRKHELEDIRIQFHSLIMATGGAGQIFSLSTNPLGSTGDGTGFALQLGAEVSNLEFMHYLPLAVQPITGFYIISSITTLGRFYNTEDEEFQPTIPEKLESATSTVKQGYLLLEVCRWIEEQILNGKVTKDKGIYWDGRHLIDMIRAKIPNSYQKLLKQGLDLEKDIVEISIGCHQMMGGITIYEDGASSIPGLFAAGEAASGFQGAERLMGTGVMDGLVFGDIAGKSAAIFASNRKESVQSVSITDITEVPLSEKPITREQVNELKKRLKNAMDTVLITKDSGRLLKASTAIKALDEETKGEQVLSFPLNVRNSFSELRHMIETAKAVLSLSEKRLESRGSFKRLDYPEKDPAFAKPLTYKL
jgi:succinate dehydrogenase/fumarate reductase flavoprotein subunit